MSSIWMSGLTLDHTLQSREIPNTAHFPLDTAHWKYTPYPAKFTLNITYCKHYKTAHCTLPTASSKSTLFILYCTLHILECTLHTGHFTVHTACYALHIGHCTQNIQTAHCTIYTAHCTLYNAHCTFYSAHCCLRIAHCSLHTSEFWPTDLPTRWLTIRQSRTLNLGR